MAQKESTFKPFVVAYGAENFRLDRDIDKACKGKRKIIRLDGDGLTDVSLIAHCDAYEDVPRTIILDNAQDLKGTDELKKYIEGRDVRDMYLILVAVIRSPKLPEVWQSVGGKGTIYERAKLKPWDKDEHVKFVISEALANRVNIAQDVADLLFEYVGPDLYRLANEVRKLSIYVGQANSIKKEHISLVTTRTPQATPMQIVEAVLQKNASKALNLFSIMYGNVGEQKTLVPVLYELMKQIASTAVIRSLQDKGTSDEDVASLLSLNPWKYKNHVAPIARKHNLPTLVGYMGQLCKLDAYVKTSSISKRTMVELTMLSIAQ